MNTYNSQQEQKIYCRYQCGTEITFDKRKSKSGRAIPIEVNSGMPHECPRSPYALAHNEQPVAQLQPSEVQQVQQQQARSQSVDNNNSSTNNLSDNKGDVDQFSEIKGLLHKIIEKLDRLEKELTPRS